MAKQKNKFIEGCVSHSKLSKATGQALWQLIEPFAAYGFNKAHAASYGIVAYQTAYLKAHFTAEFMAAVMTAESDDIETVAEAIEECKGLGINVLPPDINASFATFTVVDDTTVRFGLNAIKNIGSHIVSAIIEERKTKGPFANMADFLKRVVDKDLNKKSLESFIRAGALDSLENRHTLWQNIEKLLAFARGAHDAASRNQSSLFGGTTAAPAQELILTPGLGTDKEKLQWEKELLGLYISGHPLEEHRVLLKGSPTPIETITSSGKALELYALVRAVKQVTTKKGDLMAFAQVEDLTGSSEVIIFPKLYAASRALWQTGSLVVIKGKSEERGDKFQIIAESAAEYDPKAKTESPAKANSADGQVLEIYLTPNTDKTVFARLKELLYNYGGQTPVILRINGTKKLRLPLSVSISNNLLKDLSLLLGDKQIQIKNRL